MLALDVDGTLHNSNHELSGRTADALKRARRAGIVITISTGRPVTSIGESKDHADYIIGGNGSIAVDRSTGAPLFTHGLSWPEVGEIVGRLRDEIDGVRFTLDTDSGTSYEAGFESLLPPGSEPGEFTPNILDASGSTVLRVAAFHSTIGPSGPRTPGPTSSEPVVARSVDRLSGG